MRWALDTNTLIYFFKGEGNVAAELLSRPPSDIGVPSIALFELEVGIAKSTSPKKRLSQLRELLKVVRVIPFDDRAAQASAGIRAGLEMKGTPIGPYDVLIAGSALAHGVTLVTRNTKELSRVDGLSLESWF